MIVSKTQKELPPVTAKDIYKNRLSFCKKLIENDVFNIGIYAAYYEIPLDIAKSDLKELGFDEISNIESENPISLEKLVAKRNAILEKNNNDVNTLYKMGYWHFPKDNFVASYDFKNPSKENRFEQAVLYYQHEILKKTSGYSLVSNMFDLNAESFKSYAKDNNLQRYEHSAPIDFPKEINFLLRYSKVIDVSVLTGIPKSYLYDTSREISNQYASEKSNLIGEHVPSPRAYQLEARRRKVWELYNDFGSTHGRTQQEIADELGLTRQTVISDIKAYKKEHPEVIDITQLYQPHHLGYEKTVARMQKLESASQMYDAGMSLSFISNSLNTQVDVVKKYLMESGKINPYETVKSEEQNSIISHRSVKGYENKGQFTAKLLNNEGNITAFHGTTSHLLDEQNAPAYSSDMCRRNQIRKPILETQHKTMALLRNNPQAYDEFISKQGDLKNFLDNTFERENENLMEREMEM